MSLLPESEVAIPALWTPEGLHYLSQLTDPLADKYVQKLVDERGPDVFKKLFRMDSNSEESLEEQFPEISEFFDATYELPQNTDLRRIHEGEEVFLDHMTSGALALLAKSLPEGYSAPRLSKILDISGYLESHAYKRLLATLHMLINVSSAHGFSQRGHAVVIAQKLRLWHSAVRYAVPEYLPKYQEQFDGIPVNQCDMLATIMGFSLIVIRGWRKLGLHPTKKHEEDFYYVWKVYALMMGIHPEGEPHSFAHIPETVDDAEKFYDAYCTQYYVEAAANPEGVKLAKANLQLLREMVPWWLAIFGLRSLPRAYMQLLIGTDGCARIGIPYRRHDKILNWCLHRFHNFFFVFEAMGRASHIHLPLLIFKAMIYKQYGTGTQIMIPTEIADVWYERAKSAKKKK